MTKTHVVINHTNGKVVLRDDFDACKNYVVWANKLTSDFHRVYPVITNTINYRDREYSLISSKPALNTDPTISPIRSKINRSVRYQ